MSTAFAPHRFLLIALAASLALTMSIVAYAGHVPPAVAAHGIDKILHLTMSLVLTIGLGRALPPSSRARVVVAALAVFALLAIDEYCQRFSAHRSSDWGDLLADAVGCLLAVTFQGRGGDGRGSRDASREQAE